MTCSDYEPDPCSVPGFLKRTSPYIARMCQTAGACCLAHDVAYAQGGTEADRIKADYALFLCMLDCTPEFVATTFFTWVRVYGAMAWGRGPWHGEGPRSVRPVVEREGP